MSKDLDNFLGLCYRAQEMIFDALADEDGYLYILTFGIDDELKQLSPIEQILYVGHKIICAKKQMEEVEVSPQETIKVNGKSYIADFIVRSLIKWENGVPVTYDLKNPLIVELDGKEYHSSKEQMNYDYERENALKLAGYSIMRFTGSQVYNSPCKCLREIYEYANSLEVKE